MLTSGVYLPWDAPSDPNGPDHLVDLVLDGYTQVTAGGTVVPVANNSAVLGPIGDGTVVFTGPGKPDRIIRLDPTFVSVYQGDLADTQENNARIALTDLAKARGCIGTPTAPPTASPPSSGRRRVTPPSSR